MLAIVGFSTERLLFTGLRAIMVRCSKELRVTAGILRRHRCDWQQTPQRQNRQEKPLTNFRQNSPAACNP